MRSPTRASPGKISYVSPGVNFLAGDRSMLKAIIGGAVAMAALFFFMGLQTGAFGPNRGRDNDEEKQETKEARAKKTAPARARFPEDLAPAARAQPVPAAAEFAVANKPHKLAFLKPNGAP